jgi:hypothetical protein
VSNQIRLVLETSAKLIAVGRLEMMIEAEVAKDPRRVDKGLGCAKKEARPRCAQFGKRLPHSVIDGRFEKTLDRIPAAIDLESLLRIGVAVKRLGKTSAQRGPDDPVQIRCRRGDSSERFERQAKAAYYAFSRVGQRPVQIDQERASPIGFRNER